MSTPGTALASVMHSVVLWFGVLWVSALFVGRVYAFHEAYMRIQQELANDARLLSLCSDMDFVVMMKQHADVCSQVQVNAEVIPWLKALNVALASPTLCGRDACVDVLGRLVVWSGWTGALSAIAVALCMPQLLRSLLPRQRRTGCMVSSDPNLPPLIYPRFISKDGTV